MFHLSLEKLHYFVGMQRKIYQLVATDFCCWVPISIMAFVNFSGIEVPYTAYFISAIVLLPINSALNPILYSDVCEKILAKIKNLKKLENQWISVNQKD